MVWRLALSHVIGNDLAGGSQVSRPVLGVGFKYLNMAKRQ